MLTRTTKFYLNKTDQNSLVIFY